MEINKINTSYYSVEPYTKNNTIKTENEENVLTKEIESNKENNDKPDQKLNQSFTSIDYANLYEKDKEFILGDNDNKTENLDVQRAISDMKKDQILEQYQVFVRTTKDDKPKGVFDMSLEDFEI